MLRVLSAFVIVLLEITSCKPSYKKCNCETGNKELKAYSQLLNELVEHQFYNLYLGKDEKEIFEEYARNPGDTQRINKEVIRLQNKIFNDTTKFCILYLDTTPNRKFGWAWDIQNDTSSNGIAIKKIMQEVADISPSLLDTLETVETKYLPNDFTLCTSEVKMINNNKSDSNRCIIGKVRLSKIYFNSSQNRGLIFCEFVCGGLCGCGRLFQIEKVKERWAIKNSHLIWIS